MLYTEDFTMRHYVGFSQIRSHNFICLPTHEIFCVNILCKYATSSQRYKHFSEDMQIVIQ